MKDHFTQLHPVTNFSYFVCVIGFAMFLIHPTYMMISASAATIYSIMLGGKKTLKFNMLYMIPMLFAVACINPLFNHEGATILFYLESGNPFTLESVVYGGVSSLMLITVMLWFSCYNKVMSSDKFIYLFGKVIPALSLILAMTLRFVPLYKKRIGLIFQAQQCLQTHEVKGTWIQKIKKGVKVVSIMTSWSLENAIETSDSMKARGYGLSGRTAFSNFKVTTRDWVLLVIVWGITLVIVCSMMSGIIDVKYFPQISFTKGRLVDGLGYSLYACLCYLPIVINSMEEIKWNYFISRI